jgi:hypothetical protein
MSVVYHDKKPSFGVLEEPRTWPDDYDVAGEVDTDNLDEVYELTNTITGPWWENAGVKNAKPTRSTSVGDIVVTSKDVVFLVLPVGWQEIGKADQKIVLPLV